jgi:hypothetical protein
MRTFSLIGLALLLVATGCDNSSGPSKKATITYSADAWFYDAVDNDADTYAQYAKLGVNVDVSSGSQAVFVKVYCCYHGDTVYYEYFTSAEFTVSGTGTADAKYISVGSPNAELPHGGYDFYVLVYKSGGTTPIATCSPATNAALSNHFFEQASQDVAVTYNIYDASWSNAVDQDGDGHTPYRRLVFDVDASTGTQSVYAKVLYKASSSGTYTPYFTTGDFSITGTSSADAHWVAIGLPNAELPNGTYDFRIEVYESGGTTVVASCSDLSDSDLNDVSFETSAQDAITYTIYDASWSTTIDNDADTYSQYRRLTFDADVSSGTHTIYAKVYYKLYTSGTYSLYYVTPQFDIVGNSSTDAFWVALGLPNTELAFGIYDFRIEIYDAATSTLQAFTDATTDSDLNDQRFETAVGDGASTYSVYNTWWTSPVDNDYNGYTRSRRFNIDIDVNSGTHSVYFKLYYRTAAHPAWTLYTTTTPFSITGNSSTDAVYVTVGLPNLELSHGTYDFYVEVFEGGTVLWRASRGPTDDADLSAQNFETSTED